MADEFADITDPASLQRLARANTRRLRRLAEVRDEFSPDAVRGLLEDELSDVQRQIGVTADESAVQGLRTEAARIEGLLRGLTVPAARAATLAHVQQALQQQIERAQVVGGRLRRRRDQIEAGRRQEEARAVENFRAEFLGRVGPQHLDDQRRVVMRQLGEMLETTTNALGQLRPGQDRGLRAQLTAMQRSVAAALEVLKRVPTLRGDDDAEGGG